MRAAAFSSVAANNLSVDVLPTAAAEALPHRGAQQLPPHHLHRVCVCSGEGGGGAFRYFDALFSAFSGEAHAPFPATVT